jgi:hypothetical protein
MIVETGADMPSESDLETYAASRNGCAGEDLHQNSTASLGRGHPMRAWMSSQWDTARAQTVPQGAG